MTGKSGIVDGCCGLAKMVLCLSPCPILASALGVFSPRMFNSSQRRGKGQPLGGYLVRLESAGTITYMVLLSCNPRPWALLVMAVAETASQSIFWVGPSISETGPCRLHNTAEEQLRSCGSQKFSDSPRCATPTCWSLDVGNVSRSRLGGIQ